MGTFVGANANGGNVTAITNANGTPIAWPAGIQAGDIALLPWTMQNTATPTDPTSQTFALIGQVDDGSCRSRLLKRICTGTESGNISGWLNSLQNRQTAVLYVLRGFSDVVAATSAGESGTSTNHDCPAIGTGNGAANGDAIIVIGTDRSGATATATPPSGWAKRTNSEFGSVGSGGTYTGVADDGLATVQTMPVDPAAWVMASGSSAVTWTLALRPSTTPAVTDSGAGTDSSAVQRQSGVADSGAGTDSSAVQRQSTVSDSAVGTDSATTATSTAAVDTATATDSSALTATAVLTDAAAATDTAAVAIQTAISTTDSAAGTDAATLQISTAVQASDAATATEQVTLAADLAATDEAVGVDVAAVAADLTVSDSATATDSAELVIIPRITDRPYAGTTARPFTTTTLRPDLGITERP